MRSSWRCAQASGQKLYAFSRHAVERAECAARVRNNIFTCGKLVPFGIEGKRNLIKIVHCLCVHVCDRDSHGAGSDRECQKSVFHFFNLLKSSPWLGGTFATVHDATRQTRLDSIG